MTSYNSAKGNKIANISRTALLVSMFMFLFADKVMAGEVVDTTVKTEFLRRSNFWASLGLPDFAMTWVSNFFNYNNLLSSLGTLNFIVTLLILLLLVVLVKFISGIIKTTTIERKITHTLKIIPKIISLSSIDFFESYCKRRDNGTYTCSFTKHKESQKKTRLLFKSMAVAGGVKILLLFTLFILQVSAQSVFAGRTGTMYNLFIDSTTGGGGNSTSSKFAMQGSFGETTSTQPSASANVSEKTGFVALTKEESIGLIVPETAIHFGMFEPDAVSHATSTFEAYYTGQKGYDIIMNLTPLTSQEGAVIKSPEAVEATAVPGKEQFAVNLVRNELPAVGTVGENPKGGVGQPVDTFAKGNYFVYKPSDVIAFTRQSSDTTNYTLSLIVNISELTPAGVYTANLSYFIVPRY